MAAEKFAAEQCGRVQVAGTGPGGVVVADEDHVARVRGEAVALRPAQREHGLKGRQLRRGIPRVVDALRGLAGRSIPCGHRRHTVCDAHGFQLGLATLPGAVHTLVHNGCSFELWRMMREAGVYCEVEPRHLFNTLLPAAYLPQPGPGPKGVPDARTAAVQATASACSSTPRRAPTRRATTA